MKVLKEAIVMWSIYFGCSDSLVFNYWTTKASTVKIPKPSIFAISTFLKISNQNTCKIAISKKKSWNPSLSFLSHFEWADLCPYAGCPYLHFNTQTLGLN
jgi:hypothetical protein